MPRIRYTLDGLPTFLREVREQKGLSRAELALQLGLSFSSIRDYEQGRRRPSIKNLQRIAILLKVEIPVEYTQDYY